MKITLTGLILILSLSAFGAESWINILCYHRVLPKATLFPDVSIENFEKQMGYIKENFDVISLSDAVSTIEGKMPLTKNSVVVTFDDGDRSIYRNGWPVMKKFKLPFAVFPYTNVVNEGGRGLTWDEMRELSVAGVEFGSHGISHYFMDRKKKKESEQAYEERVKRELIESKETLAEKIGAEITFFAYPFGKFNACLLYTSDAADE